MTTNITYTNAKSYAGPNNQPLADIVLLGPAANFTISGVLVDSGADLVQVPSSAAITAGLALSSGTPLTINTAGGSITMTLLSAVSIEVEGIPITVDLLCHPSPASRPLLGRQAIHALINVGFNATSWLWP